MNDNNNNDTQKRSCISCNGTGKLECSCVNELIDCILCNGNGEFECPICEGTGIF